MEPNTQKQKYISNERAISNLMVSYAYANDDADIKKLGDMYKEATIKIDHITASGREEVEVLAGNLINVRSDGRSSQTHEITNIIIEVDEDEATAKGSAYWTLYKTISGTPREAVLSGRYHDKLINLHGEWIFKERIATILWKVDESIFKA